MNCETSTKLIFEKKIDELEINIEFQDHISECASCKGNFNFWHIVNDVVETEKNLELPVDYTEQLLKRISGYKNEKRFSISRIIISKAASVIFILMANTALGVFLGSSLNNNFESAPVTTTQFDDELYNDFSTTIDLALINYDE